MLKGNIPLDRDFSQPPKEPKKPSAKELKAALKSQGIKAASELVTNFEEIAAQPIETHVLHESELPNPNHSLIKNSPFDDLFWTLTDRIKASNDLSLLHELSKIVEDYGF